MHVKDVCALKALSNNTIAVKTGDKKSREVVQYNINGEILGRTKIFAEESDHCGLTEVAFGGTKCLVIVYSKG